SIVSSIPPITSDCRRGAKATRSFIMRGIRRSINAKIRATSLRATTMLHAIWLVALLFTQAAAAQTSTFKVSGTVVREDKKDPAHAPNGDRVSMRGTGTSAVVDVGEGGAFEFENVR